MQNGFANASSSIVQSKVSGSLVFVRLAPLSHREILFAYVGAAALRALMVGAGVYFSAVCLVPLTYAAPLWIVAFAVIGALISGLLGFVVGVWSDKFDQLAAAQNFLMMPATLLAGVFYAADSLSANWRYALHWNPFFLFGRWLSLRIYRPCRCRAMGWFMHLRRIRGGVVLLGIGGASPCPTAALRFGQSSFFFCAD